MSDYPDPLEAVDPPGAFRDGAQSVLADQTLVDRLSSMSPQARWALKSDGIFTLEDAAARSDDELLAIQGFGPSSLVRLRAWQANPSDLPAPAGRFLSETREDRVHALYGVLRANGQPPAVARELAVAEVDALTAQIRGAA